ncbi:MAG: hypothetical protein WAR57_06915, partial [Candidatus Phosphoribacter sp.]
PLARPSAADPALRWDGGEAAYGELGAPGAKQGTRALAPTDLGPMLRAAVSVWRADGSIVLVHYAIGDQSRRLAAERVTLDMTEPL